MSDITATSTPSTPEQGPLARKLAAAEARAKLAAVGTSTLGALAPVVTAAPKGEVSLGAKAGSLAPWLTHQVLAAAAHEIADGVRVLHASHKNRWRILVTADAGLLNSDVRGDLIRRSLTARAEELAVFSSAVTDMAAWLEAEVRRYQAQEASEPRENGTPAAADELRLSGRRYAVPGDGQSARAAAAGEEKAADEKADVAADGNGDEDEEATKEAAADQPLGAAVDLVRLVATDFTVTAAELDVDGSLLALLTAGALGRWSTPGGAAESAADEAARAAVLAISKSHKEVKTPEEITARAEAAARKAMDAARAASQAAAVASGEKVEVLLDGFDVSYRDRPTFQALKKLAEDTDALSSTALRLQSKIGPVAAELADRKAQAAATESVWTKAAPDKDLTPERLARLKERLERLTAEISRRQAAVGPAQTVLEHANAAIETARTDLAAVTTADPSGVSPIARACAREVLHLPDGAKNATHVLYVRPTHSGADVITRRSILGSSGRVSYLGGATTAWALAQVSDGELVGGGVTEEARQLTHDLASGRTTSVSTVAFDKDEVTDLGEDPLANYEKTIRLAVLWLAVGLGLLGVAAALAVAIGPIIAVVDSLND